ncbi:Rsm22-domain-containing protein [Lichtheimia hyalospora FSU 10163]|nr:Rsm22-domain-containing protein [Lichtheimia hyalospora FSU 10163]
MFTLQRFPRTIKPLLTLTRRWHTTEKAVFLDLKQLEALEQLESVEWAQVPAISQIVSRRSAAAEYGRKRIGAVPLPKSLIGGISEIIQESDKKLIRTDALRIYESLRSTSRIPTEDTTKEPHTVAYGPRESLAYLAGAMPSAYAATFNVLHEISHRLPDFKPKTILDFGTGPGTALWASHQVYEDIQHCTGVDLSEDMLSIAERLQGSVAPQLPIDFKRYLALGPEAPKPDLVISAFTLGDIPSAALQKSIVRQLWDMTGNVLVLIDRGTPIGFSNIARARQYVLDTNDSVHVVAPCPHDKPCPLLYSPDAKPDRLWCHFSQRVQRPQFLMKTKHSKSNAEDAKYSYVVLRRGERPKATEGDHASEAYTWSRLVQAPMKKQGHVIMDVCTNEGEIQRMVVPKSQGKVPYKDARKIAWGDLFPHPPKNKPVVRMSKGSTSNNDDVA